VQAKRQDVATFGGQRLSPLNAVFTFQVSLYVDEQALALLFYIGKHLKEMRGMSLKEKVDNEKLKVIEELLNNLRFGELQITVHEGKIVQINRIEKKRFPA